jgi:PKD repeat protein
MLFRTAAHARRPRRRKHLPGVLIAIAACLTLIAPVVASAAPPTGDPSGLTASYSNGAVHLAWQDNSSDETGFSIERCLSSGCTGFAEIGTVGAGVISFADTTFQATANRYRVRAFNADGFSGYSNIAEEIIFTVTDPPVAVATATPASGYAPLTVTLDGTGSHPFNPWDAPIVRWDWSFGDGTLGSGSVVSHVYNPGAYTATLTVTDSRGATGTASVAIVANQVVLTAPTNLTASSTARGQITLNWTNPVSTTTTITVERCRGTGCSSFTAVAQLSSSANSLTDTRLKKGTSYTYRLRVSDGFGTALSNSATAVAR